MSKKKIIIQSYIFDKKVFRSNKQVQCYLNLKHKPVIISYTKTKRFTSVKRNKFKNNSLRTKTIAKGVKIIKGVLK